ncbi:S26 family signal peptidase, partial [Streptomyces sp. NPDC127117]|uniref:S26 family signal peptidase n=1 Tax=Streptomyces sp. NPDC127117 TaxID=3345368 RepID=UPI00362AD8A1
MAAGARPGHGDPAEGPDRSADPAVDPAADSATGPAADPVGGAPDPDVPADEEALDGDGKKAARKQRPFWKELPLLIVVALVLALLIKTFLVQAFSIPSDSMQNTLQRGDRV